MKLATFEEELAAATAEFSAGLNAVGVQILALDEAATAMRSATRSLDARDLPSGREQEESALKWLINARENVRTLLSTQPSEKASARAGTTGSKSRRFAGPPTTRTKS